MWWLTSTARVLEYHTFGGRAADVVDGDQIGIGKRLWALALGSDDKPIDHVCVARRMEVEVVMRDGGS